jgi:hypothetical protein
MSAGAQRTNTNRTALSRNGAGREKRRKAMARQSARRQISWSAAQSLFILPCPNTVQARPLPPSQVCTAIGAFVSPQNPLWCAVLKAQSKSGTCVTPVALLRRRFDCEDDHDDADDGVDEAQRAAHMFQSELVFQADNDDGGCASLRFARSPVFIRQKKRKRRTSKDLHVMCASECTIENLEICAAIEWGIFRESAMWPRSQTCDILCGALLSQRAHVTAGGNSASECAYSIARCAARLRAGVLLLDCGARRSAIDRDRHIAIRNALTNVTCALSHCGYSGRCLTLRVSANNAMRWSEWREIYVAFPSDNEPACDAMMAPASAWKETSLCDFVSIAVWTHTFAHQQERL